MEAGFGLIIVFTLIMLRVPVGVAMLVVGIGGFAMLTIWRPAAFMTGADRPCACQQITACP